VVAGVAVVVDIVAAALGAAGVAAVGTAAVGVPVGACCSDRLEPT
jgi:hypothetical protein